MTTTSKSIAAILKKAGVAFRPVPKDWDIAHLAPLLHHMVPDRICEFDPKCIVEAADYVGVLNAYAQATLGEFAPESPRAEGRMDGTIALEFLHAGQTVRFKFTQEGRGVADGFVVQLRKFCKKHLSGNYLSIGTALSADVYLPHKVISHIEKKMRVFDDVDSLVQFVLDGTSETDLRSVRDRVPRQVKAGYTRSGESLLTALAKSKVDTDTFLYVFENFDAPVLPNRHGESVAELAQRIRGLDLAGGYLGERKKTLGYAEIREKWGERLWENNHPEYMRIIEALAPDLPAMRFTETGNLFAVSLCHAPLFDLWSDSAELSHIRPDDVYTLNMVTLGPGGGALYKEVPADRADTVIDLLQRYCCRTLWTTPGQDGAWLVA